MDHTVEEVAFNWQESSDVQFFQMDTDENYQTVSDYNIRFIPSVGVFKDGVLVSEIVGSVSSDVINAQIDQFIYAEEELDVEEEYLQ